jgi:uncharacterized membrane protein (UPF0127 family)
MDVWSHEYAADHRFGGLLKRAVSLDALQGVVRRLRKSGRLLNGITALGPGVKLVNGKPGPIMMGKGIINFLRTPHKYLHVYRSMPPEIRRTIVPGVRQEMRQMVPAITQLDGQTARAVDVVGVHHELAEATTNRLLQKFRIAHPDRMGFAGAGHFAPSVLLREHNILRTLTGLKPTQKKTVIDLYRQVRAPMDEMAYFRQHIPGYVHGESPRLSRHALKRIDRNWLQQQQADVAKLDDEFTREFGLKTGAYTGLVKIALDYARGIPDRAVYGDVLGTLKPGDITDFVLQHHKTTRNPKYPHYDLRLGTKDTNLFSWAVPKAELPAPGTVKRPIPQTQLHTYQYGSFEGKIPHGYGAGDVRMADKGKAIITRVTPNTLHFTLGHTKVPTRYVLVHIGGGDNRMWQLIAKPEPGKVPGVGDKPIYKQINAVDQDDAIRQATQVQEKIDGAHGIVNVGPKGEVDVYSVNPRTTGRPISHTERMGLFGVRVPQRLQGTTLRGEMYFNDSDGKAIPFKDVSGLLNTLPAKSLETQRARGLKPRISLFDAVQYRGERLDGTPLTERQQHIRELLKELPDDIFHEPQTATTPEDKQTLIADIKSGKNPRTREGVMAVMPDDKVMKLKNREEATGYLTGTYPGTGKRERTAGGLTFVTDRAQKDGPEGRVGTGFTEQELAEIVDNLKEYIGRPMRLEHQGQFGSGKLRSPSFSGWEVDKTAQAKYKAASLIPLRFINRNGAVKASASVEIADTAELRRIGLSKRASLPDNHGMFFDKVGAFWMKDVHFPLDLVFVDRHGMVLEKHAMPVDNGGRKLYRPSSTEVAHAIELPSGWCDRHGITIGDVVRAG